MSDGVPPSAPAGTSSPLVFRGAVVAGRYRLDDVLGTGGMGSVWSATHLGIGQQVAIKFVWANLIRQADLLQRFDREAKAAGQIKSRHVPQVYDNGSLQDGTPFLAMELLHGETLFKRIHKQGPIPLAEAITILEQVCRALGRAHALGIIHRDIKPDNIYLAREPEVEGYVVKVLDFGIAKFTQLGDQEQSATRTGALIGTPQYMSPEQARSVKNIDLRTDLYSLGVVAYTMLTGNLAFSGESLGDLLLQICAQPLPSLIGAAPWLPPALEGWFHTACAREPQGRYPSAQAFIDALKAASTAPPPQQSQPSLVYAAQTGQVQVWPGGTTGGGGPLGAASTTAASSLALQPAPRPARAGAAIAIVAALLTTCLLGGGVALMMMRSKAPSHPPVTLPSPLPLVVDAGAAAATTATEVPPPGTATAPATATTTVTLATATARETATAPPATPPASPHPTALPPRPTTPPPTRPAKPNGTIDIGY